MTERMEEVLWAVRTHQRKTGRWYRATGNGERVTLAALWRCGQLERRVWRGKHPNAAHEYWARR